MYHHEFQQLVDAAGHIDKKNKKLHHLST